MGIPAYILIAGTSSDQHRSEMLERAGYRCRIVPSGADPAKTIAEEKPNVAFVGAADQSGLDVIRALKGDAESRRIPLVAVDVGIAPDALRACYGAGVDDIFEDDAEDAEILARLVSLVRLSGMEAELLRRAATAREFGLPVSTEVEISLPDDGFRLLVVGVEENEFEAMCPMLSKTGISYLAEPDPYRARSRMEEDQGEEFAGALVYVKGGEAREKSEYFCHSVRNDRRLFDLPLFVVADEGAFADASEAYGQGASVVAHTPIDCDFVDVHLRMLVRGRELRQALGERIAAALGPESADRLGTVYSSEFIQAHLDRLDKDSTDSGRQSTAVLFFVPTIGEVAALYGEDGASRLRQQMADWLSGLVRIEDIVGRTGSDEFLMLLPETSTEHADRVRKRVIGVLHQSEFRLTDNVPVGVEVYVQSGLTTLQHGDTLDNLVQRASDGLE